MRTPAWLVECRQEAEQLGTARAKLVEIAAAVQIFPRRDEQRIKAREVAAAFHFDRRHITPLSEVVAAKR